MDRRNFLKSGGLVTAVCATGAVEAGSVVRENKRKVYVNEYVGLAKDLQDPLVAGFYRENGSGAPSDFG